MSVPFSDKLQMKHNQRATNTNANARALEATNDLRQRRAVTEHVFNTARFKIALGKSSLDKTCRCGNLRSFLVLLDRVRRYNEDWRTIKRNRLATRWELLRNNDPVCDFEEWQLIFFIIEIGERLGLIHTSQSRDCLSLRYRGAEKDRERNNKVRFGEIEDRLMTAGEIAIWRAWGCPDLGIPRAQLMGKQWPVILRTAFRRLCLTVTWNAEFRDDSRRVGRLNYHLLLSMGSLFVALEDDGVGPSYSELLDALFPHSPVAVHMAEIYVLACSLEIATNGGILTNKGISELLARDRSGAKISGCKFTELVPALHSTKLSPATGGATELAPAPASPTEAPVSAVPAPAPPSPAPPYQAPRRAGRIRQSLRKSESRFRSET